MDKRWSHDNLRAAVIKAEADKQSEAAATPVPEPWGRMPRDRKQSCALRSAHAPAAASAGDRRRPSSRTRSKLLALLASASRRGQKM